MKKLKFTTKPAIALYAVLCLVFLCGGCSSFDGAENDVNPEKTYEIKTIDSCEYIYVSRRPYSGEFSLTHKGNCKYCRARGEKH